MIIVVEGIVSVKRQGENRKSGGGKTVKKAAAFLVDKRRIFLCLFLALAAACLLLAGKVHINYDLAKYLPDDSDMKQGLALMEQEFGETSVTGCPPWRRMPE